MSKLQTANIISIISGSSMQTSAGTLVLAGVQSPNYNPRAPQTSDKFGFLCKEFLRQRMAGRTVQFEEVKVLKEQPRTVLAFVYIGNSFVNEQVLLAGYGQVQEVRLNKFMTEMKITDSSDLDQFYDLNQEQRCYLAFLKAKKSQKGIFSPQVQLQDSQLKFADLTQKSPELTQFCQKFKNEKLDGYIEHVRDAESFYVCASQQNQQFKFVGCLFGVQAKNSAEQQKYLQQLLQKPLQVQVMQNVGANLVALVLIQKGKDTELNINIDLLEEKLASVVEWQVKDVEMFKDFAAPKEKEVKKEVKPSNRKSKLEKGSCVTVEVVDVTTSDSLIVNYCGQETKIFLASIMAPKCNTQQIEQFGIECRQYLRAFYGKKVDIEVEYIRVVEEKVQSAEQTAQSQDRIYCSVYDDGQNIALEMVSRGLVKVLTHKKDDPNRAKDYQQYKALEEEALQKKLGVHSVQTPQPFVINELSNMSPTEIKIKSSQLGVKKCVVEHVMTGGKLRCSMLNQNQVSILTVTPVGCKVPSLKRGEMWADEATQLLKEMLFQEVELTFVGGVERHTNCFFALIKFNGQNYNVKLLEKGLANFMNVQLQSSQLNELQAAERRAISQKLGLHGVQIPQFQFKEGSFKAPIAAKIEGLAASGSQITFRFVDQPKFATKAQPTPLEGKLNQYCLVQHNGLKRALVKKIENGEYQLQLIDEIGLVTAKQIFQLSPEDQLIPQGTVSAELAYMGESNGKMMQSVLEQNFVGKTLNAHLCGLQDGSLQLFLQAKEGQLECFETLNSLLLEDGVCKLKESDAEYLQEMAEFEQEAIKAHRGLWK